MRDILFRAKRLDNGEWVVGQITHGIDGTLDTIETFNSYCNTSIYEVDPDTVGEWTGLTDKNGVKIFEGDVVRFKRTDALGWTRERIGKVLYYDKLPIFYILSTTGDAWDWCVCEDIEVIGNIYDNADLMER